MRNRCVLFSHAPTSDLPAPTICESRRRSLRRASTCACGLGNSVCIVVKGRTLRSWPLALHVT